MKIKPVAIAVYAAMGVFLTGCFSVGSSGNGGSSDSGSNSGGGSNVVDIQGTAADGLLVGAKVCLDENGNWQCDTGEPTRETDENGKYQLSLPAGETGVNKNIIIEAGAQTPGNETGGFLTLIRQVDDVKNNQDVTPLTTLMAQGVSVDQLKKIIGADKIDLDLRSADAVVKNPVVKQYAVSVAKVLATKLSQASHTQNIGDVVKSATQELATRLKEVDQSLAADKLAEKLQQVQVEVTSDKLSDVIVAVAVHDESGQVVPNASVKVELLDNNGKRIIADNGASVITGKTDEKGRALIRLPEYTKNLPKDSKGSVYATAKITVSQPGFAPIERVVRNVRLGDSLTVQAAMAKMPIKTQKVSSTLQFSSAVVAADQPLVFAVVGKGESQHMVAGAEAVAQAAGEAQVVVQIPKQWIKDGTKAITAAIRGFDSTNEKAIQAFPGEFKGQGKPGTTSTVEVDLSALQAVDVRHAVQAQLQEQVEQQEVQLVSAAFARIDLTDQNGEKLKFKEAPVAEQASEEADSSIKVYLQVPANAIRMIRDHGDQSSAPGWQVPVYVFDGHIWKYAGLGTLVTYDNKQNSYTAVDSLDVDKSLYAEIKITKATEWMEWINLDWPVSLDSPKPLTGSVVYAGERAEPYTGDGWIVNNNQWDWVWIEEGAIQGVQRPDSVLNGAKLVVYNDRFNYTKQEADIKSEGEGYVVNMKLTNPYRCEITGVVKKEIDQTEKPLAGVHAYAYTQDYTFYIDGATNPAGEITLSVPCKQAITMGFEGIDDLLSLNVDGKVNGDEEADVNGKVTFELKRKNIKPYLWVGSDKQKIILRNNIPATFTLYADAYDPDDNSVSINLNCPEGTQEKAPVASAWSTKSKAKECQVDQTIFAEGETHKTLTANITAQDASGGTSTESVDIEIEKETNNHPPVLFGLERSGESVWCDQVSTTSYICNDTVRKNQQVTYEPVAYDPDGDEWQIVSDELNATGSQFTLTPVEKTQTYNFTLKDQPTDGGEPQSATVKFTINAKDNQPPTIWAGVYPEKVRKEENAVLDVYIEDDVSLPKGSKPLVKVDGKPLNLDGVENTWTDEENVGYWKVPLPTNIEGEHKVEVSFTDTDGASTSYESGYSVQVNEPPQISFVSMPEMLTAGKTANIAFSVVDDGALSQAKAVLRLKDEVLGVVIATTEKTGLGKFDQLSLPIPENLSSGQYKLSLEVEAEDGQKSNAEVTVKVIQQKNSDNQGDRDQNDPLHLIIQ